MQNITNLNRVPALRESKRALDKTHTRSIFCPHFVKVYLRFMQSTSKLNLVPAFREISAVLYATHNQAESGARLS